jgi:hypothetical protein
MLAGAAIDQSYVQTVHRNGTSSIEKTMEVAIFSDQFASDGLERMDAYCSKGKGIDCSVDVEKKRVTITESFASGGYYAFSSDYGLPFITHTLVIDRIPSDRFATLFERLLIESNATPGLVSGGTVKPTDLGDEEANSEVVAALRLIQANITYTVVMPVAVSEAGAGNASGSIDGSSASFDLVEVLDASKPITVKSRELNLGYLVAIAGVVVLVALALSFFGMKPAKRRKR